MDERVQISESRDGLCLAAIVLIVVVCWFGWLWFVNRYPSAWQVLLLCALSLALRFVVREAINHQTISMDRRYVYVSGRKGELKIPFSQVRYVRSLLSGWGKHASWRITVELSRPSALGDRIVFTPNGAFQERSWRRPFEVRRWKEHPVAVEMLNRKYRRKSAT